MVFTFTGEEEETLAENVEECDSMALLRPVTDSPKIILARVVEGSHEMDRETAAAEAALHGCAEAGITSIQQLGASIN